MTIFNDAGDYLTMMDWAKNIIGEHGIGGAEKLLDILKRDIAQPRSCRASKKDLEKLEDMKNALVIQMNRSRVDVFVAPGIEAVKRQKKYSHEQSEKRQKRQTWAGLSPEQRAARNKKIIEHFKKSGLTKNSFAERNAAKYGLKPSRIRSILST
jgi:hypothetical protein